MLEQSRKLVDQSIIYLKKGKPIILMDEAQRENEGDIIFPAEITTPERINFMLKYCSGIICVCLTPEHVERLSLPMMVPEEENTSAYKTAFTVSVEAREGVTTGVSAADRARTIQVMMKDTVQPSDLVRPGHVFPLKAAEGGVLKRAGHTEGAIELVRLAGFKPAAVLCELMNSDGTMARLPEINVFAKEHDLAVVNIRDLQSVLEAV